ncbi:hypothetical protein ACTHP3_16835 [Shouchella rhizosphaerae]
MGNAKEEVKKHSTYPK